MSITRSPLDWWILSCRGGVTAEQEEEEEDEEEVKRDRQSVLLLP